MPSSLELAADAQDVSFIEELTLLDQPDALRVAWVEGGEAGSRRNRRALFTSFPAPIVAVRTIVPQWRRGEPLCLAAPAETLRLNGCIPCCGIMAFIRGAQLRALRHIDTANNWSADATLSCVARLSAAPHLSIMNVV